MARSSITNGLTRVTRARCTQMDPCSSMITTWDEPQRSSRPSRGSGPMSMAYTDGVLTIPLLLDASNVRETHTLDAYEHSIAVTMHVDGPPITDESQPQHPGRSARGCISFHFCPTISGALARGRKRRIRKVDRPGGRSAAAIRLDELLPPREWLLAMCVSRRVRECAK